MENALMYVEPLFLQAEGSYLPELKRVIAATGPRIVMEESLEAAMAKLLGAAPPAPQPPAGETVPRTVVQELIAQAGATYRRAQQLLRQGDLAGYAREIERLGEILHKLEESGRQ